MNQLTRVVQEASRSGVDRAALHPSAAPRLQARFKAIKVSWMAIRAEDTSYHSLSHLPEVDASRLAIVGHSRGAMASLRVAAQTDRLKAVVALQPVADLSAYVLASRAYAPTRYEALSRGMGDTPEAVAEAYRPLSAIHFADRIRVTVLLIAGTQMYAGYQHADVVSRISGWLTPRLALEPSKEGA